MLALLRETEAKDLILGRLRSRSWWCFVVVDPDALEHVADLEEQFYSGSRAGGFQLIMGPSLVPIALGAKEFLSKDSLQEFFQGQTNGIEMGDRDILCLRMPDTPANADMDALVMLSDWLGLL
jgi:hypothetical protein